MFPQLRAILPTVLTAATLAVSIGSAQAQTGVSDDRVALPDGPGSLEGVGDNAEFNANMGMMTYNVAIRVPSGYSGMTPRVALAYSSGNGPSEIGIGWRMFVPSVERMTNRGLPEYDRDDWFVANGGAMLSRVDGSDEDAVIYRERFEAGFARYTWHEAGDGGEGYWTVENGDGRTDYYGADADGDTVASARATRPEGGTFRYMLVETIDPYGHSVRYSYDKFGGNYPLLTDVTWVHNEENGSLFAVAFDYDAEREDVISDGQGGFNLLLEHRLKDVLVTVGGQQLRRYELDHEDYDESGGFTRLTGVRTYGADDTLYPIHFSFDYSQALGGECDAHCEDPYVVDMGNTGVSLTTGAVTFVDINGDALPDMVDTTDGEHRFFVNRLRPNGDHEFEDARASTLVGLDAFTMGSGTVEEIDVNGDGFADLVNQDGGILFNTASGDWIEASAEDEVPTGNVTDVFGRANARFLDADNDKFIDLLRINDRSVDVYRNRGEDDEGALLGFEHSEASLSEAFDAEWNTSNSLVQLNDLNGDGLLDLTVFTQEQVRYALNLGLGRFVDPVSMSVGIEASQHAKASLEDINGDGLDDVVWVEGDLVTVRLNRAGRSFRTAFTLGEDGSGLDLPTREDTTQVLYADMNGNGTTDIVWVDIDGQVTYLEVFPLRPNLLTRIENHIGMIQSIGYGTSVEHLAADDYDWDTTLPHSMVVVERLDVWDELTEVHHIVRLAYHDGFYDGTEKQFRGFARVEISTDEVRDDEGRVREGGSVTESVFDVGAEAPYRAGTELEQRFFGGSDLLMEQIWTFGDVPDCAVAGLADEGWPYPVEWNCLVEHVHTAVEGGPSDDARSTVDSYEYDGYGNTVLSASMGFAEMDGDETYVEADYIAPGSSDQVPWLLGLQESVRTYGEPGSDFYQEERHFYDGEPFEGLAAGEVTRGFVSRISTRRSADPERFADAMRAAPDAHGNTVVLFDPRVEDGVGAGRSDYTYDEDGLLVEGVTKWIDEERSLRIAIDHDPLHRVPISDTQWTYYEGDEVAAPASPQFYLWDEFGRLTGIRRSGAERITDSYEYDLAAPTSRIIATMTTDAREFTTVRCMDGRGRVYQTRSSLDEGYLVSGFSRFAPRGNLLTEYESYAEASDECTLAPPSDVPAREFFYDGLDRLVRTIHPDAELYGGTASEERWEHGVFQTTYWDVMDTSSGDHSGTTQTVFSDGLARTVEIQRDVGDDEHSVHVEYDELGHIAAMVDAAGNRHEQTHDVLGRVLTRSSPNAGMATFEWDDVGHRMSMTDGRGIVTRFEYDGVSRRTAQFNPDNADATRIEWVYDLEPSCVGCGNTSGRLASVQFPNQFGDDIAIGGRMFGYDARGRRIYESAVLADQTFESETVWDTAGMELRTTHPDGTVVDREYDGAMRLTGTPGYVDDITYDERGLVDELTYANGLVERHTHDSLRRRASQQLMTPGGDTLLELDLTRDRIGNILDQESNLDALGFDATYDAWYQIVSVAYQDGSAADFAFDELMNPLNRIQTDPGGDDAEVAYTFGDRPNAPENVGGVDYEYDEAGAVIRAGGRTFTWDDLGRLTAVAQEGGENRYHYGAEGAVVMSEGDGGVTLFVTDEFEVRDGVATTYVMVSGMRVARADNPDFAVNVYTDRAPSGALDGVINSADAWMTAQSSEGPSHPLDTADNALRSAMAQLIAREAGEVHYLHNGSGGWSIAASDEDGELTGVRSYSPFGQTRHADGFVDHYGFGLLETDASGLARAHFRWYDAHSGRWISPDPLHAALASPALGQPWDALAGYAYGANNGYNRSDVLGLTPIPAGRFTGRGLAKKRGSRLSRSFRRTFAGGGGSRVGDTASHVGGMTAAANSTAGVVVGVAADVVTTLGRPATHSISRRIGGTMRRKTLRTVASQAAEIARGAGSPLASNFELMAQDLGHAAKPPADQDATLKALESRADHLIHMDVVDLGVLHNVVRDIMVAANPDTLTTRLVDANTDAILNPPPARAQPRPPGGRPSDSAVRSARLRRFAPANP